MDTVETLDEVVALAGPGREVLYVRFSEGPGPDAEGTSLDGEAGVELPGLSVCRLTPEPWWTRSDEDWVARRLCKYLDIQQETPERRPWLLTGRVVGSGTDHEPLVADPVAIAWVGPAAVDLATEIYRTRFDVAEPVREERETT